MKIILDEIEFILPEPTFQMIKDAYNHGRVQKASEISKNYWSYQIKHEDKQLECELKYGKNQVSKILCACGRTNIKQPCLHAWIAAYWHYIKVVSEKKHAKPIKEKLKIEHLDFSNTELIELTRFIQLSLKLNRNLEAWAQFIIPNDKIGRSIYTYFYEILSSFNNEINSNNKNNKLKIYKEQLLALDFVYEQALHEYIQGSLEKAFFKLLSCFSKISEWVPEYKLHNHTKMLKFNHNIFHAADQILKSIKSAELSEQIFKDCMTIIQEQNFKAIHYKENIYQLLLNNTRTKLQKKSIENHLNALSTNLEWLKDNEVDTILFLMSNLDLTEFRNLLKSELMNHINNQSWLILIQKIKESDNLQHYIIHLKEIFDKCKSFEVRKLIAKSIIENEIYTNNIQEAKNDAQYYSILLNDLSMAKIHFSNNEFSSIESYINEYYKFHNKSETQFILQLLHELDEKEILLNYFSKSNNIEDIFAYDSILYKTHWNEIKKIYLDFSEKFLDNYIGIQANQFLERIKLHIKSKTTKIQFDNFNSDFQKQFPERLKIVNSK